MPAYGLGGGSRPGNAWGSQPCANPHSSIAVAAVEAVVSRGGEVPVRYRRRTWPAWAAVLLLAGFLAAVGVAAALYGGAP